MQSDERCSVYLKQIEALPLGSTKIMEVCGTHTMAIAKSGIRSLLPEQVQLLSGPGCPVCVTPQEEIDEVLELAMERDVILTSYGDMLRVPGSHRGDSLLRRRALGADVRTVYSPMDALQIARENPEKQTVFLGIGFETTAPGTAVVIRTAAEQKIRNFTVLSLLKSVEPALRALIATPTFCVQGFLCPGHVATVIGEKGFRFLPEEYGIPAVVGGFEPEEILLALYRLSAQIAKGEARIENAYPRAVRPEGNPLAQKILQECFEPGDARWRGLGEIPGSGFAIRGTFSEYDARKRFRMEAVSAAPVNGCRCGEVITGRMDPTECPLFAKACTPEDPVGPCMVSSEGSCAAAYKYRE